MLSIYHRFYSIKLRSFHVVLRTPITKFIVYSINSKSKERKKVNSSTLLWSIHWIVRHNLCPHWIETLVGLHEQIVGSSLRYLNYSDPNRMCDLKHYHWLKITEKWVPTNHRASKCNAAENWVLNDFVRQTGIYLNRLPSFFSSSQSNFFCFFVFYVFWRYSNIFLLDCSTWNIKWTKENRKKQGRERKIRNNRAHKNMYQALKVT